VTSIYDEIKQLYDALNDGEIKTAKELLSSLISKGVNKLFIIEGFRTLANTRMMEVLFDEVEKSKKSSR